MSHSPLYPPESGKALCHIPHSPLVLLESFNSEVLHGQDRVRLLALKIMSIKKAELLYTKIFTVLVCSDAY